MWRAPSCMRPGKAHQALNVEIPEGVRATAARLGGNIRSAPGRQAAWLSARDPRRQVRTTGGVNLGIQSGIPGHSALHDHGR